MFHNPTDKTLLNFYRLTLVYTSQKIFLTLDNYLLTYRL